MIFNEGYKDSRSQKNKKCNDPGGDDCILGRGVDPNATKGGDENP